MLGPAFAHADRGGGDPLTAGPFTELRKSPLFQAPALSLAKTWGPAIPPNTPFQVEKVYGRWVFGRPTPLAQMKAKDFAPSGWVFSRNLLIRGDTDTINPLILQQGRSVIYHSRALNSKEIHPALDFLETLVLSKRTLEAFSRPESNATGNGFKFFPEAHAEEENPGMGLTGTELNFLNQEIRVLQERRDRKSTRLNSSH